MNRATWGLWVFLVVLFNAGEVGAQEPPAPVKRAADAVAPDSVVPNSVEDDREASFLPPPVSLLKVEEKAAETAAPKPEKEGAPVAAKPISTAAPATPPAVQKPKPVVEAAKPESAKPATEAPKPVVIEGEKAPSAPAASSVPAEPSVVVGEPVAVTFPPAAPVVAPANPAGAPPPAAAAAPVVLSGGAVAQTPLADVDPETLGILSPANGGLGASLWKDTQRSVVDRLMPAIGLPAPSATLNDLARRLFLTTAAAPVPYAGKEKPLRSLLSQRIEALMALGAVSDAWRLAGLADPKLVDAVTLRLLTEAAMIGPDSKEVCDKIPSLIAAHGKTNEMAAEWQKSLLICQLRAGDVKAVQLGVDLMREQGSKDDVFLSLMNKNVLGGVKLLPRQLTPLRPLNLAVLRHLEIPLPSELYRRGEASMIPELVRAKAADEKVRIELAEKSAARGILTASQLATVYKDVVFTPEEIAGANSSNDVSPRSRAMAYQALEHEQAAQKKIDLVQKVIAGLDAAALTGVQGQLVTSFLEGVPLVADYNAFSVSLARLFALAGKPDKAVAWLKLAQGAAAQNPDLQTQLNAYWPIFVLSGIVSDGEYAAGLKGWMDSALNANATKDGTLVHEGRARCGNTLLLLGALGYAVADEAWQRVIEPLPPTKQMVPSPVLIERLAQASAGGRKGETVLLSLLLTGGSAGEASFPIMLDIIRALRQVGLTAEAQGLAREVLVGLSGS